MTSVVETIDGLGDRENEIMLRMIRDQGVLAYEGSDLAAPLDAT